MEKIKNLINQLNKNNNLLKYLTLMFMFIIIIFIQTILRNTKDAILVPTAGAEAVPFIKALGVPIIAGIMFLIYTRISTWFNRITVFYIVILSFVGFFLFHAFVLLPLGSSIFFSLPKFEIVNKYENLKSLVFIIENWPTTLFYAMAELWGVIIISITFWQLVNQLTKSEESKEIYPVYMMSGQIGLAIAGIVVIINAKMSSSYLTQGIQVLAIIITIAGLLLCCCMYILQRNYSSNRINGLISDTGIVRKKTIPLGFFKSLKHVFTNKYIFYITLLVFSYAFAINIAETMWKKQIEVYSLAYGTNKNVYYSVFQGQVQTITAFAVIGFSCIAYFILKRIKWSSTACITLVMIGLTGISVLIPGLEGYGIILFIGSLIQILGKGSKYAFFDPNKEMCFIPLDENSKTNGKAAVENIGSRFGKGGASWVKGIFLIAIGGSLFNIILPLLIFFILSLILWVIAIVGIVREQKKMIQNNINNINNI